MPLILKSVTRRPRLPVPPIPVIKGNVNRDLAVLRPENQNATHVTPRIAKLATGWFKERLVVVGSHPPRDPSIPYDRLLLRVRTFVQRVFARRDIRYRQEQRIRPRSRWLKYITIDGIDYAVRYHLFFSCLAYVLCRLEMLLLLPLGVMKGNQLLKCRIQQTYLKLPPWQIIFGDRLFALIHVAHPTQPLQVWKDCLHQ